MSSDPTTTHPAASGTSQNDQVDTQGVVPTVLSYVGLGGNNQSQAEPAFGADVRPSNSAIGSDHEHARDVAARATGGVTSGYGSGAGVGSGVGAGSDSFDSRGGSLTGSGAGSDSLNSRGGSLSGAGVDASRGSLSGAQRDGTNTHSSIAGASATEQGLEGTSGGIGDRKEARAAEGASEGSHPDESKTSAESRQGEGEGSSQSGGGNTGGPRGKLENLDAIPVAGGVKLGEKHWGESDIVPDNPKPKEEANVSSSEGQPDQSTKDNTSANTGGASGPPGSGSSEGEQKEGFMDKIKDKLHH